MGSKLLKGIFIGYKTHSGGRYTGDLLIADVGDLEAANFASEVPIRAIQDGQVRGSRREPRTLNWFGDPRHEPTNRELVRWPRAAAVAAHTRPWTVHVQSMDCPWTVHGQSMDCFSLFRAYSGCVQAYFTQKDQMKP